MATKCEVSFYVYQLIDPRNYSVFYVGKGSGSRIDQHEKDARRGQHSRKCDVIRQIESEGLKIIKLKVAHFNCEQEAYDHETQLIDSIGLERLTNVMRGGQTAWLDRVALLKKKEMEAEDRRMKANVAYLRKWLAMADGWQHGCTVSGLRNGGQIGSDFLVAVRQLLAEMPMGVPC